MTTPSDLAAGIGKAILYSYWWPTIGQILALMLACVAIRWVTGWAPNFSIALGVCALAETHRIKQRLAVKAILDGEG